MMKKWNEFILESDQNINTWKEEDNKLKKTFKFKDFQEAFSFITKVASLAEEHQHHPKWSNLYNIVEIELSTHDSGDVVTQKDYELAEAIDKIVL